MGSDIARRPRARGSACERIGSGRERFGSEDACAFGPRARGSSEGAGFEMSRGDFEELLRRRGLPACHSSHQDVQLRARLLCSFSRARLRSRSFSEGSARVF